MAGKVMDLDITQQPSPTMVRKTVCSIIPIIWLKRKHISDSDCIDSI